MRKIKAPLDLLVPKIETSEGCWTWLAALDPNGYGVFRYEGRVQRAHRAVYKELVGPLSDELDIDHLCRNPACVNPDHLEPVTHAENMRRGSAAAASHCKRGHEFSTENTVIHKVTGRRLCRTCRNAGALARHHRNKRASMGMGGSS